MKKIYNAFGSSFSHRFIFQDAPDERWTREEKESVPEFADDLKGLADQMKTDGERADVTPLLREVFSEEPFELSLQHMQETIENMDTNVSPQDYLRLALASVEILTNLAEIEANSTTTGYSRVYSYKVKNTAFKYLSDPEFRRQVETFKNDYMAKYNQEFQTNGTYSAQECSEVIMEFLKKGIFEKTREIKFPTKQPFSLTGKRSLGSRTIDMHARFDAVKAILSEN